MWSNAYEKISKILKLVDLSKTQKSKYLEN